MAYRSEAKYSLQVKIFYCDPSGAMCRGSTLQSAIPALWLQSVTPALRIRFGTLRQWCVKFLPRIFYPFWAPHGVLPKPGFRSFVVRLWIKFSKFRHVETSDLYANSLESFPPGFFTYLGRPMAKNYKSVFSTVVRPNGVFDRHATKQRTILKYVRRRTKKPRPNDVPLLFYPKLLTTDD